MNKSARDSVQDAWDRTVKARALCPYTSDEAVGAFGYLSPPWYRDRGATYFVNVADALTAADVIQLREVGAFINQSFVITMAAILEASDVVPYRVDPVVSRDGGQLVLLTKWLRNRFAHGEYDYDPENPRHAETRALLEELLPVAASQGPGFVISIDEVLEPLKDGVLRYIAATE